jgi:uncharacterized protein YjbI with pentapeptide repeats
MASEDLQRLMHAVLDGQASPDEARALEARLAADPDAQAEFEAWRSLFGQLRHVPQADAPADLLPSIRAALRPHQLSAPSSVIEHGLHNNRSFGILSTLRRLLWPAPSEEFGRMSINRKLVAGGAFAAVAVGIAAIVFDYPPKSQDVMGTIAPAERYRAPQAGAEAVKLGDQTIAQLMQSDAFDRIVKDPELSAFAKQSAVRDLARVLQKNADASRVLVGAIDVSRATVQDIDLAKTVLADADLSRSVLAEMIVADRVKLDKAAVAELKMERARAADAVAVDRAAVDRAAVDRAAVDRAAVDRAAVDRAVLERALLAQPEAALMMLRKVDVARLALEKADLARVIVANAEASRVLMSTDVAARALSSADAQRMMQSIEASRSQMERASR